MKHEVVPESLLADCGGMTTVTEGGEWERKLRDLTQKQVDSRQREKSARAALQALEVELNALKEVIGRPILYTTTTQTGWCTEAFVSILAHLQSRKLLPGGGGV